MSNELAEEWGGAKSRRAKREVNWWRSEEGKSNRVRSGKPELKRGRSEKCTTGSP